MGFKDIHERFLKIEAELDLFNKKIDSVYFWERVRVEIYQKIFESLEIFGEPHSKIERNFLNKILFTLRSFYAFILKNPFFAKSNKIVFFVRSRRKLLEDGKWWEIYTDPIIDCLSDNDYVFLEHPYMFKHFKPARTKNLKYLDAPLFLAALRRELGLIRINFGEEELIFLRLIEKKIKQAFGISLELKNIICRDLRQRKSEIGIYEWLFKKLSPKIVILGQGYGWETVIEVCKKLKITTIELQHGVINKYHLGYSFPGIGKDKRMFPDYFFAFGDFWKNCVEFPIKKERIFSVGYPYLERETNRYRDIQKKDQIIFISSGDIGKELSKFAVALSNNTNLNHSIIYKLHPGEYYRWRKKYPSLDKADREKRVMVIEKDNPSLYKLMAESKIQIGVSSTAIYEGLNFKLDTYLLNLPGIEYMDYLISCGAATVVSSVEEFIKCLILPGKNNRNIINISYFFEPNSLENMILKINKLSS